MAGKTKQIAVIGAGLMGHGVALNFKRLSCLPSAIFCVSDRKPIIYRAPYIHVNTLFFPLYVIGWCGVQEEVRRLEELRVTEKEELPAKVRGDADTLPRMHRLCSEKAAY